MTFSSKDSNSFQRCLPPSSLTFPTVAALTTPWRRSCESTGWPRGILQGPASLTIWLPRCEYGEKVSRLWGCKVVCTCRTCFKHYLEDTVGLFLPLNWRLISKYRKTFFSNTNCQQHVLKSQVKSRWKMVKPFMNWQKISSTGLELRTGCSSPLGSDPGWSLSPPLSDNCVWKWSTNIKLPWAHIRYVVPP